MNPRVINVNTLDNYNLHLEFSNGEQKIFDMSPYINKGIFQQLKEPSVFNSAKVVYGTVQWSNEADLCPDTLYLESKPA